MKALTGMLFVEFASPAAGDLERLFLALGFSKTMEHRTRAVDVFTQGDIVFLVNREPDGYAGRFARAHGPGVVSMGWSVRGGAEAARDEAVAKGAPAAKGDHDTDAGEVPAVAGVGETLIYFVADEGRDAALANLGFVPAKAPVLVRGKGFLAVDHLTNNVAHGDMEGWSDFYKNVFGFTEIRTFDIRGEKTGLLSYALRSPSGNFSIPINEGTEAKSQINEYLEEHKGAGIQHIALSTHDILGSLGAIDDPLIGFLDIEPSYYAEVFDRVPGVTEDRADIQRKAVLVDGDPEGYLLQIFTKNVVGPLFFEIIQRKNHHSFGEGNFGALFRSIERDQERRGYL